VFYWILFVATIAALYLGARMRRRWQFKKRREQFNQYYRQYEDNINATLRQREEREQNPWVNGDE
jgi:hypothetical protein